MLNLIARNLRLPSEELDAAVPAPEEDDTAAKILRCCNDTIICFDKMQDNNVLPQVQENLGLPTRATGSAEQAILSSKAPPLNTYKSFTLKSQPCSRVEVKLGLTGRWIR